MQRLQQFFWRYLAVGTTGIVGICLTLAATQTLTELEKQRIRTAHENRAVLIKEALEEALQANLSSLYNLADLIEASESVDDRQFKRFTHKLLQSHSHALSLTWVPVVPHADRPAYEQTHGPIRERLIAQDKPMLVSAPTRVRYFPTANFAAANGATGIYGLDLGGEVLQRRPLVQSYHNRTPQLSEVMTLPNATNALVVFIPVAQKPGSRGPVRGFIRGIFALEDLINDATSISHQHRVNLYLTSDTGAQNPFLASIHRQTHTIHLTRQNVSQAKAKLLQACRGISNCQQPLAFGQFQWKLIIPPPLHRFSPAFQRQLWLIKLLGGLTTAALAVYMVIILQQTRRINKLVHIKTRQTDQLNQTLTELQTTQSQLVQSAKMSSLGQLVAGIAHEINNPVNFIHGNLKHITQYSQDLFALFTAYDRAFPEATPAIQALKESAEVDFLQEDLPKLLASMQTGTDRIREIVLSLRNFSRLDEADFKSVDLHDGIESTLMILTNQLKGRSQQTKIQVVKQYEALPKVSCYPGLINQVLMSLLTNAIDAIRTESYPEKIDQHSASATPTITIQTQHHDQLVRIGIHDNGPGISPADQAQLFDPFFTTKPVGEGTGLSLSISYKIITEKHQGKIWTESILGQGSAFWLEIPISHTPTS